ncbi:Mu-like prophage FluMu protein gp41 [Escherichia coli]|uniref:Mu-like prophage FluMu protein gp41 n=1 Tax=Escherichia coli TaxID=562 RepID=A0A376YJI6_ECOLX|nr:Mu-like prophage FluMu protein gp41 [Escherichia coli]
MAAEKVVMSKEGPVLVSSPSLMGLEMLRRQIAGVGCLKGPLSLALMRKLSVDDFQRLSLAVELRDMAVAASLTQERGEWLRCRMILRKRDSDCIILKSGPEWALSLPLSAFSGTASRRKPSLNITVKSGDFCDRKRFKSVCHY